MGAPPRDTVEIYVELREKDLNFVETILKGYDGIAHLRRDWFQRGGRRFFKILVPPGLEAEVERVLESLRRYVWVGEVRRSI